VGLSDAPRRERRGRIAGEVRRVSVGGNSTLVYFSCTDCATEAKRAAASGGAVFKEKFSIGQYGFIALVTDTEGNMIGLHSMQ
jgi:predicted enzyme related to lactoylglutathione lyase